MDPDNQPSTSKKAKGAKSTSVNNEPRIIYPVTFEEFTKFANVEEYVLKEMQRAGSETCRINYKIRHKYYPVVYKQFYASHVKREKMLRNGLTLKPIPKFLKEKLMQMPVDEAEASTSKHKHREKPPENESKVRYLHETSCISSSNKLVADNNNSKLSHLEKENSSKPNLKPVLTKAKSSAKLTPKNDKIKGKSPAAESGKITNFFFAPALSKKSTDFKYSELNQDIRKRKPLPSESAETEPQIKRLKESGASHFESIPKNKNIIHKVIGKLPEHIRKAKQKVNKVQSQNACRFPSNLISDESDAESNLQIMVDVAVPINSELIYIKENMDNIKKSQSNSKNKVNPTITETSRVKKSPNRKANEEHKRERKININKRKSNESKRNSRCKIRLDDLISDDSDIQSNVEMVDLTHVTGNEKMENPQLSVTSPLPRRNRTEDFKKPTSPRKKENKKTAQGQERNQLSGSDTEMALLTLSGMSTVKVSRTINEIHEWLQKGLNVLKDESDDEQNTTQYLTEEYIVVDRLQAVNKYTDKFRKYIKYLLNLEIQKRKATNLIPTVAQGITKSKIVSAFLQMTFDDYKILVNAENLLSQRLAAGELIDTITTDLKNQYEAIIIKERPWPKGVYMKLSALRKYLRSKGIQEPVQLKDIPPRILSFEEVLEHTNLKKCTSLSRDKPPDTYKHLLDLCKKDYLKCCREGVWIEGIKFNNSKDVTEKRATTLDDSPLSESMSIESLRVHFSDLKNTQQSLNAADVDLNPNNKKGNTHDAATEDLVDSVFNESGKVMSGNIVIDSLEKLKFVRSEKASIPVESHENTEKHKKFSKRNSKRSQNKTATQNINKEVNVVVGKSSNNVDEIERYLDEIFKESDEHEPVNSTTDTNEARPTVNHFPTDYNALKNTLSGDFEKPAEPSLKICQTSGEQRMPEEINMAGKTVHADVLPGSLEASEGIIINDSPGSACQLLNNIIQPTYSARLEFATKITETSSAIKPQEMTGLIPPSPNLFQSSGESDPKCSQSQPIEGRAPETVYVPCKHSTTFHTEENNLTALSFDQTSDNTDPFAETSNNGEDMMINGMNVTMLPTPDSDIIVKQEILSTPDVTEGGRYFELDDSVQILDLPASEPIVIEDEETAPDLLEMLLSRPTRTTKPPAAIANLTSLPSSSFLGNFPQAQQLPSNFNLTQSQSNATQSRDVSSLPQTLGAEKDKESAGVSEATDSHDRLHCVEFIKIDKEYELESTTCQRAELDSILNLLKTESQESNCTVSRNNTSHKKISFENLIEQPEKESSRKSLDKQEATIKSLNSKQPLKETLPSGSSVEMSYVSIAPQNIPSEIDLTQNSSNKSSNQSMNSKKGDFRSKNVMSSTSIHEASERQSVVEAAPIANTVSPKEIKNATVAADQQTSKAAQEYCDKSVESTKCSQESVVSVYYVYVTKEGNISEVMSSSSEGQDDRMNVGLSRIEGSEDAEVSKDESDEAESSKKTQADAIVRSSEYVSKGASECLESSEEDFQQKNKHVKLSTTTPHAEISKDDDSEEVELIECSEEEDLESSTNIQDSETSDMIKDVIQDTAPSARDTQPPLTAMYESRVQLSRVAPNANISGNNSENIDPDSIVSHIDASDSSEVDLLEESDKGPIEDAEDLARDLQDKLKHVLSANVTEQSHVPVEESKGVEISRDPSNEDISKSIVHESEGAVIQDSGGRARDVQGTVSSQDYHISIEESRSNAHAKVPRYGCQEIGLTEISEEKDIESPGEKSVEINEDKPQNVDSSANDPHESSTDVQENANYSNASEASSRSEVEVFDAAKRTGESKNGYPIVELLDMSSSTNELQDASGYVSERSNEIAMDTTEVHKITDPLVELNPPNAKAISTNLTKDVEVNSSQQSESGPTNSPQSADLVVLKETAAGHEVISHTTQQSPVTQTTADEDIAQQSVTIVTEQIEETTKSTSRLTYNRLPFRVHKRKIYNIPALLPLAAVQNDRNNEVIEAISTVEGEDESEDLVQVPFLINRRFIASLPFNLVTSEQMQQINEESTIFAIKVNLEIKLKEHCVPTHTCPERVEVIDEEAIIGGQEAQLSSTIHRCQFDEKIIRDWLGDEAIATDNSVSETTSNNVQPVEHAISDPQFDDNAQHIGHHAMCLRNMQKSQKMDGTAPLKPLRLDTDSLMTVADDHSYSNSPVPPQEDNSVLVQSSAVPSKTKPPLKTKKKTTTPKKSLKKHSELDFVPQRTHAFRSLPLGTSKKPITESKQSSLTGVEEIDYLVEDASQVVASSTASQILGTDCTYFEGSQLLRNIDDYCVPEILLTKEQQLSTEPQVNNFNRIIMSEGIMARKVWQVNLQWKTKQKMTIEVRLTADNRSLTVCDKSAKLLFNFSPATWSDVLRVLREIDHFEYKRMALKNCRVLTPLHNVLRSLLDSSAQVVNIRMINDSFNPYTTCEEVKHVYRRPFQCLTKTIPANVLSRINMLKENLRKNNLEE